MKRTTTIFILVFFSFSLVNCKPKRVPGKTYFDKPSEYNDYIVKEQKAVMACFDDFAGAVNGGDIDSMSFMRKHLSDKADEAEALMSSLADFKTDTMFRHAASELFKYVQYACEHELREIVSIASKETPLTEMDVENIRRLSEEYTKKEKEKNDALIAEQEKFAKKFNVNIQ